MRDKQRWEHTEGVEQENPTINDFAQKAGYVLETQQLPSQIQNHRNRCSSQIEALYGMETAQRNEPQMKRLDIFQLKALRKVLELQTTFENRGHTYKHVLEQANE